MLFTHQTLLATQSNSLTNVQAELLALIPKMSMEGPRRASPWRGVTEVLPVATGHPLGYRHTHSFLASKDKPPRALGARSACGGEDCSLVRWMSQPIVKVICGVSSCVCASELVSKPSSQVRQSGPAFSIILGPIFISSQLMKEPESLFKSQSTV